jgi:mRNA interferase RelE/StbE
VTLPNYKLALSRQAERVLKCMATREPVVYVRVARALDELEQDPSQGKRLTGELKGRYSYRVGSYRILYTVQQHRLVVYVIDVGHRRDIYR